jgi:type IV fimbrial biogenesis protein FimT
MTRAAQRGVTLIELMIALVIMSIVLFIGVPAFTIFLQNQQIKNAAQTVMIGLDQARAESIRRNTAVRFQFVTNLTAGCTLANNSLAWVVSLADPDSACDATPGSTAAPQIIEKRSATEGTRNVAISTVGGTTATFSGLGRLTGAGITKIRVVNSTGTCEHLDLVNGKMRCLNVEISTGGEARMCDPKVIDATDPRFCKTGI